MTISESTPLLTSTASAIEQAPDYAAIRDSSEPELFGAPAAPAPDSNSKFGLTSFLADLGDTQNGTVPVSVLIASVIGVLCGVFVWVYYTVLYGVLDFVWSTLPKVIFAPVIPEAWHWTWIPIVILPLSIFVGLPVYLLCDPGDLKVTVGRVHKEAYVPLAWAPPMILASIASIVGAGSLGPEAPLITICGTLSGWVSLRLFGQRYKNLVRRHTLCGMSCATAAFFGVPLGGALFALEVNNRLGYEYFEHALYAIFSATVCLAVFRYLGGLEMGPVWQLTPVSRNLPDKLVPTSVNPPILVSDIAAASASDVAIGAVLGVVGAVLAAIFAVGHKRVVRMINSCSTFNHPVTRSMLGGAGICAIGLLIPQSLFWGEYEIGTIGVAADTVYDLPHLWPSGGLTKFEISGFWTACAVGFAKLAAISITVASGYRGGFIFPFFTAGAAFGRAACYLVPALHPVVAVLAIGAGINASITRTALATPLILTALAGEPNAGPPVLAASLVATFATAYMPFITEQRGRDSLMDTQLYSYSKSEGFVDIESSTTPNTVVSNAREVPVA